MSRKPFLSIVSVLVIISVVFGPPVSLVQAAEQYEAAREAAAVFAPSERANMWPHPQNPRADLALPTDSVGAALNAASLGLLDAELFAGVVRVEPLSMPAAATAQVDISSPTASSPAVPVPESPAPAPRVQPWDLQAFLDRNADDVPIEDLSEPSHGGASLSRTWNWFLGLFVRDDAETGIVVEGGESIADVIVVAAATPAPIEPTPVSNTEESEGVHVFIYLPVVLRIDSGLPSPVRDEAIITTAGGTLISTDFLVRVDVPADAYSSTFRLRYIPAPERGGLPRLEATTLDGEPIVLQRAARLAMRLPERQQRSGNPLFFRVKGQTKQRTVSVAASVVDNTIAAPGEEAATDEMLSAYVYEFGEFVFASLPASAFAPVDSVAAAGEDDEEEDPDEYDDGLVIDSLCFEPGEQGPLYTFPVASIYTTTEELDPWGFLDIFWDEIVGYDEETGEPIIETQYDPNNPYRENPDKMTYVEADQSLFMGLEEVGEYEPGTVLSFTFEIDDLGGPYGHRYDTMDEGRFQAGFEGCVSGSCEAVAPTIGAIKVAQSGQQKDSSFGTCWVSVAASDNSGAPSLSMTFNGQSYSNFQAMEDGSMGVEVTECYLNDYNYMQVSAVDECGNTSTTPEIPIWGTGAIGFGPFACGENCGYQGAAGDPINTSNGNYFDQVVDIEVMGVGETALRIERAYNSMAALWTGATEMEYSGFDGSGGYTEEPAAGPPQFFGPAWTFPYATYLLVLDKAPFYEGVQIQYGDGRTVNFVKDGDSFVPESPANSDTLTIENGEYVLRHMRTLEVERFNADGQLVAKEDRNGNRITLIYDGELLTRVENDSGRWLEFVYNGEGLIETISAPEGKVLHYGYTDGLLTSFTDARGNTTVYAYDNENNMLTSITTPRGHTSMEQTYDEQNRVDWQRAGRARINTFVYSEDGSVTTVTDAYNNTTTYTYNEIGQMVQMTDALGRSEVYGYDENYNRNYRKDKAGREWFYTFNEWGMKLTEDGPLSWHREWEYNDLNRVIRVEDALGRVTDFEYDVRGNLTKVINAIGGVSTTIYDSRGLPVTVTDFNGNKATNTYDPVTGDLIKTRNGAGDEISYTHDDLGRITTMTDGIGTTYTYAYDGNDNLVSIDGPLGYHLGYAYDENNNLVKEIDPNGGETEYTYDESEKMVRVENQLDFPTIYEYDDMDNLIRVEDAEGREWQYEYDAVYNRIAEHGPEDTHTFFAYDSVGNLTDETRCNSPLSGDTCPTKQVTHYEYDELDRIIEITRNYWPSEPKSADTNVTATYTYDLVGNVLVVEDANGNATTYQYNDLDLLIREEDAENQVTRYGYDAIGNLTSVINPRGFESTFTYDGANRLATATDALNHTRQYIYDGNGNVTDMIDPEGVITHNDYTPLGYLESVTLNYVAGASATVDQNVTTEFVYDLAGNMRFVYDPRGTYQTEHRYDAAHRRILTIDAEGGRIRFAYDKVNNQVSIIDGNGHETRFDYDGLNRQVRVTNPEGHSVSNTFDRLGNLLVLTDARGHQTRFTYDGMNRSILIVDAMGGEWEYEYDAMGNLMRHIDANDHTNDTYTYDKVYRILSITDAEGYVTSFTYDANGNRLTLTDGNRHTTTYTYDELDRLASLTNAENETTQYRYDALGNQAQLIENDGVVTLYDYDPIYRLATVTQNYRLGQPEDADTNVDTHYGYDEVGNLLSVLDAEEHETRFFYDGLNRMVQEVDAEGNTWDYEYDPVGNRIARTDANRNLTLYEYYPDDQLKRVSYYDDTFVLYTYDENNNRTVMQDHLGITTWEYDPLNRVTDVTDPFDRHLGYEYDPVSNRTGLTYADGRTVNYTYYRNNWLKTAIDPEGNVTTYERDGVGQVTRQLNPNHTIAEMTYDKANRLLTLMNYQVDGARKVNSAFDYTYDEVGQRTQVVSEYAWRKPNEIITSIYTYDPLRRLIRDEDSRGVWTDYTFDRVGNRLTLVTNDDSLSPRPFDEKTLVYTYNDINQVLTIVDDTHPGNPSAKRTDNVAQAIHAFQHEVEAQRGKHIEETAADTLLAMADALIADLYDNPAPDQLEVETALIVLRAQVESDYTTGAIDNAGTANSLLVKLRFGADANNGVAGELQTTTFLYDANGNRVNKEFPGPQGPRVQGTDYIYDPENRLVVAHDYQQNLEGNRVDRQITRLEYDGDGRRLVKEYDPKDGGGGTKRVEYVFDGLINPVAEYNIWNPQYENFYRADQGRIITMHHFPSGTQGQMYWFHYDGMGSTSGLTKHLGQSSHNYRYEPYGQIEMPPGNFTDPHNHYTFTGKEWDEHTELYYFGARHYDPIVGVWLTQDTFRGMQTDPRSLHRYGYVQNNPTNYIDPDGHFLNAITGAVGAAVGAVVGGTVGAVADYGSQVVGNLAQGKSLGDSLTQVDTKSIIASGVGGAVQGGICGAVAGASFGVGLVACGTIGGAAGSATTKLTSNLLNGGSLFDSSGWEGVGEAAVWGGVTGTLTFGLSNKIPGLNTLGGNMLMGTVMGGGTQIAMNLLDGDPCTTWDYNVGNAAFQGMTRATISYSASWAANKVATPVQNKLVNSLQENSTNSATNSQNSNPTSDSAPDFVVTPDGDVIPVPKGATGPTDVTNSSGDVTGFAYTGGEGGNGLNSRVDTVRIMDPTPSRGASPGYPGGYATYQNSSGQKVNPSTGQTVSNSDPTAHIPINQ